MPKDHAKVPIAHQSPDSAVRVEERQRWTPSHRPSQALQSRLQQRNQALPLTEESITQESITQEGITEEGITEEGIIVQAGKTTIAETGTEEKTQQQ